MRSAVIWGVALVALITSGCSRPGVATPPPTATSTVPLYLPDLVGVQHDQAKVRLQRMLLVPVIRFAPELTSSVGEVVGTEPRPGTEIVAGAVVVVIVAGKPSGVGGEGTPGTLALGELAEAQPEVIVGVATDPDGTLVVAFSPGVDLESWRARVTALARDERVRLQSCPRSGLELRSLQSKLSERTFLPRAKEIDFGIVVDVANCRVTLSGAFTSAEIAELTQRYGDALAVFTGR